ncbi:cell division protein FtsL [Neisseria sp. ZJ106]|uniref:Cell division protein FtsL n=1 Tax=Neisseria lisongii TaxID=2912188 RepID=A0AAW5AHK9_9NEIS|nr:cell division protein FtsL [Neisseria lisongii]MCF7521499.1 cell division protein FtsL [Neisseria lisongii]MCF7529121.1 cell division protein FtsL [Neisseria lisongii]WCL71072.1 cell division protein FtsL [Neisseria lisongii]
MDNNKIRKAVNIILLLAVWVSGFFVVTVQDQTRQYFVKLQTAEKQKIEMDQEFARLKLEQAKLANHKLIKVAAEHQNLKPPTAENTVMAVRPK